MFGSDFKRGGMLIGLVTLALLGAGLVSPAIAADREQELINRLITQNRQLEQELTVAQEARAKAEAQAKAALAPVPKPPVASSSRELKLAKAASGVAARRVAELEKELQGAREALAEAGKEKQTLAQNVSDQAGQLGRGLVEAEKAKQVQQALTVQRDQCRADNAQLYATGVELLKLYQDKGFGAVLGSKEPFLQVGRVQLENVGAQYAEALKSSKVKP
jgi:hypothetical protein